ncbi:MAG: hypothetical protein M1834_004312 [Cirrosporium novae-zelandiae]|nr:MAG: hypothetical protein M1834_004312 [Cirrosporium novae-zelandiae]
MPPLSLPPTPSIPISGFPPGASQGFITLPHKPSVQINYFFVPPSQPTQSPSTKKRLLVFLNGLILPQEYWKPTILALTQRCGPDTELPAMLSYDRYGQGLTVDRDPHDQWGEEGYGHDLTDTIEDLHHLITQIGRLKLDRGNPFSHNSQGQPPLEVILVANSIGCAIARLYAHAHLPLVTGLVFLDSMMANSNFDFFPDPDAPSFDMSALPNDVQDIGVEGLRLHRKNFLDRFHPSVKNEEGLDRRNAAELLPKAGKPVLAGPAEGMLAVVVVEHDPQTFAEHSFESMGTPIPLSNHYTNPIWNTYNKNLVKIAGENAIAKGPIIAKRCGHFIQRDDPEFAANIILALGDALQ